MKTVSGSRFCDGCGSPLEAADGPRTGASPAIPLFEIPASDPPQHLAETTLMTRATLEGERKQVTVLFVDVAGFTSLSEQLDPEDVHSIMTRAFELMRAEVHRVEGTVNQFLGDGIMALFGAPIAHEDHAQRAVHAALGIQRAINSYQEELQRQRGISFQVRQGLNTGLVVVGSIGPDLRMDYTALGDTTNIAARLQQAAGRGQILVSKTTHRVVEGYFYTRELGGLVLKGKAEPVKAWEILGARMGRTRMDIVAERGLTPYIGREPDMQALLESFDKAQAGHGQVVFLVGEAGIGKSRLLYEFRRKIGTDAAWSEGQCLSFGQSIALHPVVDMMKRNFHIEDGDSERTIAKKIERAVLAYGEDLASLVPYLRYLLSLDPGDPSVLTMDPQQRRGEIFDALRRLLVRASTTQPQIRVHEDCHWIDTMTEEYLHFAADSVPNNKILDIFTYRTGHTHPFGERTYHRQLMLTALSSKNSVHMAEAMLSTKTLPHELNALVASKAEGNPFFVEELVNSLQETGAIRMVGDRYVLTKRLKNIFVPNTIQDIIMARIDRLDEAPKKTLQFASVIGRAFTRRLLDRITDLPDHSERSLQVLQAMELIYEQRLSPELAYIFKHALTHDVAYGSLLMQRRKELHRTIALAIEELYADRLSEQYEVLAHHFTCAENWQQALDYLLKSAQKALHSFANHEAIVLYDQALEVIARLGDAVDIKILMSIREGKSHAYLALSEFMHSHAEGTHLLALARRAKEPIKEGAALAGMGFSSFWLHDFDRALAESREAIEVAGRIGAEPVIAAGRYINGFVYAVTERLDAAKAEWTEALHLGRATAARVPESLSLGCLALHRNWEGAYTEAAQQAEEAVHIARAHRLVVPLLWSVWISGLAAIGKGAYDDALKNLEQHLIFCEKVGAEVIRLRVLNTLGWLWIECGNTTRALDMNRRSMDGAHTRGDPETSANAKINLADVLLAQGNTDEAGELADETYRMVNNPATSDWMRWRYSTHLFTTLGDLSLAHGDHAKAQEWADQCLEIATRTSSRKNLAKGWRLRGEIELARHRWDDADTALQRALTFAKMTGNPTQIWKTHAAIGRLYEERHQPDAAHAAYAAARNVLDGITYRLRDERLRASFDASSSIQDIYRLSAPR
jgi:class 3 adenylate cyclase/tetratricopeptide (TPR) repeat protein